MILLLLLGIAAPIKFPHKTPFVAAESYFVPEECRPSDPMTLCGGINLKIVNPLFKAVDVLLHCTAMGDSEEVTLRVYPRNSLEASIELTSSSDTCWIADWKRVK